MEYELFDTAVRVDRELPFRESERGGAEIDVAERGELVEELDPEGLGVLDAESYEFHYGGWLVSCRRGAGEIRYAHHPVGELRLPLWHVLERMAIPILLGVSRSRLHIVHGSAVRTGEGGWLFVGETGAGKSTTAYRSMRDRGAELASDEMALVDVDRGAIRAGAPALRLHPELGAAGAAAETGPIHPALDKKWYRFPERAIATGTFALRGICVLNPVDRSAGAEGDSAPALELVGEELEGGDRLTAILEQSFDFEEVPVEWREVRFRNAGRLAKTVPVYEIRYRPSPQGEPTHVEALWTFLSERGRR